mgnify:CR=1 FL=1
MSKITYKRAIDVKAGDDLRVVGDSLFASESHIVIDTIHHSGTDHPELVIRSHHANDLNGRDGEIHFTYVRKSDLVAVTA